MYSVSSIAWKFDGSRLALGTVTGAVDLYDACIRRYRYKGKFEFTYVSLSQAIRARARSSAAGAVRSSLRRRWAAWWVAKTRRAFVRQAE